MSGFGSYISTESIPNALPIGRNSPQKVNYGLYAERISGSSFTMTRSENFNTWVYRINPSVKHGKFHEKQSNKYLLSSPFDLKPTFNQLRWNKFDKIENNLDFINGLYTIAGNGCTSSMTGAAIHIYNIDKSMENFFCNADGELLIIPVSGELLISTELGELLIKPLEIAVIPRGIKFQIKLIHKEAYGYVCENYGIPFKLPDLGPIGSYGLANNRDFLIPQAKYNDLSGKFELICKFEGQLWSTELQYNPLDVVAWHGNYYPYKYNLELFNTIGTVSFDHPDPSIFTVLTSPSAIKGQANIDFVIFPPRFMVAENTFRPPWFHRNIMSEFMGLICGSYDAKPNGFNVGGASLHNRMQSHGPDAIATKMAINNNLKPEHYINTMAFMLESYLPWRHTEFAINSKSLQQDYYACWQNIEKLFNITT